MEALIEEFPDRELTVFVDAGFRHGLAGYEVSDFEERERDGQIKQVPAGTKGGGDAVILATAAKKHAVVVSNDNFAQTRALTDSADAWPPSPTVHLTMRQERRAHSCGCRCP